MSSVLTTVTDETALKVAADIRDYGHGYLRIDREGRAEHIPSYLVADQMRETAPRGRADKR